MQEKKYEFPAVFVNKCANIMVLFLLARQKDLHSLQPA